MSEILLQIFEEIDNGGYSLPLMKLLTQSYSALDSKLTKSMQRFLQ